MAARRYAGVAALVGALVLLRGAPARAHALSPSMLLLHERAAGIVDATWRTPSFRMPGADLRPVLPDQCTPIGSEQIDEDAESMTAHWSVDCGGASLIGMRVGVEGLGLAKTDALLHIELADGRTVDSVIRAREPYVTIPAPDSWLGVARRYGELGYAHIIGGYDHLLFVFGLLLLAPTRRALLATITAFTVGHSLTLTLAVLGITHVPPAPIEVLIALSIFVLAVELSRGTGDATLMQRAPWLMALTFGFLHGLGFAGALRETGLPAAAIPMALLSFNVGIELGQLAFVAAVLLVTALARPVTLRLPTWSRAVPVYVMGSLAAFWMIERALPLIR
jgi:hypothetical protein